MSNTTADLLASVKARAMMPSSQATLTDEDILRFATEELQGWLFPKLIEREKTSYLTSKDYVVSAKRSYRLPKGCEANAVYKVSFVDETGYEDGLTVFEPSELKLERGCYIKGAFIVLTSTVPTTGTLRIYFNRAPSDLVLPDNAAVHVVTSVDSVSGSVELDDGTGLPGPGGTVELVKAYSPFDVSNFLVGSLIGNTITVDPDASTDIEEGDYIIYPTGSSPVPQLPKILHPCLAKKTTIRVLEALEDTEEIPGLIGSLEAEVNGALNRVSPRVETEERVISSTELTEGS